MITTKKNIMLAVQKLTAALKEQGINSITDLKLNYSKGATTVTFQSSSCIPNCVINMNDQ